MTKSETTASDERVWAAIALHRAGRLEEAEQAYLEVLEADESNAEALHYLGVLRYQQGRPALAIELVQRALELKPDYVDAYNNLGNFYLKHRPAIAASAYRAALELQPDHPDALRNLEIAMRKLRPYEEAVEAHQRAIEQDPAKLESYYSLSGAYAYLARDDEAVATLRKALAVKPEGEGFLRLGQMLFRLRRTDEAVQHYEAWLRAEPANPIPKHMLAAHTLKDVPARAEDGFVASTFDRFAEHFEEVLVGRLEYRAPALIDEALKRIEGEPRGALDVVDAGCGTGLLAQCLRPYARRLVGVDLSLKMLEKAAAARARYDQLVTAELTWYLASSPGTFDLVACADTLIYFGDLREVLAAARTALRQDGRLFFTLEHADEDEVPAGYRIHPHGRYSHTEPYVRRMLAEAGFELVEINKAHLRREREDYVAGLVVAARLAKEAGEPQPDTAVGDNLARALELHRQGQLHQAEAAYLAVLRADESNAEALHGLGTMRYRQGWLIAAFNLLRRAIEVEPLHADAHASLGHVHRQLGSVANAALAYQRALELRPDHAGVQQDLAPVLEELERLERSAAAHRRALEQDPEDADHLLALSMVYQKLNRADEEEATLRKALAIRPEPDAFRRLGILLRVMGRLDEAAAVYEAWLRAEPDSAVASHMLAACTGKDEPSRASDASMTQAFDSYADTFDEALRKLEYRAPALVAAALRRGDSKACGELDVMDAGCGTGLLAQYLRPYARRLVGVDLSPRMLEKAAQRAMYDELVAAELTAYLGSLRQAFDIVASSDTLVYFGDLRAVLAAARATLRPGGRLVFTLEHAASEDEAPAGYRLFPEGRYKHTQQYVRRSLDEAGFEAIDIEKGYLRREGTRYVDGLVVAARAPKRPQ